MNPTPAKASVRTLFFQTIIYGIGLIVTKTTNFLLLPLYTNFFPPEDLGLYNLVFTVWMFYMTVYALGFETSFLKFFIEKDTAYSKSTVYSTTLAGLLITSLIFSAILYIFAGQLSDWLSLKNNSETAVRLFRLLSLTIIFDLLFRFPLLLIRSELNPKKFFLISNIFFISNLALNIIFIAVLNLHIEAIFYAYIISAVITLLAGLAATKDFLKPKISFDVFKKMLVVGSHFILTGVLLIVIEHSDRFFLNYYFGEATVGIYSACYRLGGVMLLAVFAFKLSWTPFFLNISKDEQNKKVISDIFTYFIFGGLLTFLFLFLFLDDIVRMKIFGYEIISSQYQSGLKIVPIILLAFFFSGLNLNFSVIPLFTNNSIYILLVTFFGCVLNIILNFILISKYEMTGAAISTLISYAFMFTALYYLSQKVYYINYEWKKVSVLSVMVAAACLISSLVVKKAGVSDTANFIINVLLIAAFLFIVNYFKIIELKKVKTLLRMRSKKEEI